ncbi:hypothetical protein FWF74_01740 [Candidatus Saccharibacteria bacterium]|nr:hypothetical protein [Candidatus Saccharibacteria bacterium]MCL1963186.1 hypothetical protein [Candidatus Saccharibacteria bacterium]
MSNLSEKCAGGGCPLVEACSGGGLLNLKRIVEDPKHQGKVGPELLEEISRLADLGIETCQNLPLGLRGEHVTRVSQTAARIAVICTLAEF